ncbi:PAM68 family protein [Nodosilinea sp. E11]|uniref:PAM68 family protein n=1 Tax=Nodosilinea sp. E11 TaxID=3037479 RepID=UPI002934C6F1|nr:PAM68 family protein [Nodosilinea sp. E11]WOD41783.1 PAM68 family protein [Nodosilinea sp. E11]
MASESSRKRLPFEPVGKGAGKAIAAQKADPQKASKPAPSSAKSTAKKSVTKQGEPQKTVARQSGAKQNARAAKQSARASTAIPEVVSNRMLRRMLAFSGVPTLTGILTFFVSYYLVVNRVVELPSYFVLLITLGCFGLGVVGLTYGVLSSSWDEDRPGSRLGLDEFKVNFGRMTSAWGTKSER